MTLVLFLTQQAFTLFFLAEFPFDKCFSILIRRGRFGFFLYLLATCGSFSVSELVMLILSGVAANEFQMPPLRPSVAYENAAWRCPACNANFVLVSQRMSFRCLH